MLKMPVFIPPRNSILEHCQVEQRYMKLLFGAKRPWFTRCFDTRKGGKSRGIIGYGVLCGSKMDCDSDMFLDVFPGPLEQKISTFSYPYLKTIQNIRRRLYNIILLTHTSSDFQANIGLQPVNPLLKDRDGKTALALACTEQHEKTILELLKVRPCLCLSLSVTPAPRSRYSPALRRPVTMR